MIGCVMESAGWRATLHYVSILGAFSRSRRRLTFYPPARWSEKSGKRLGHLLKLKAALFVHEGTTD